VSTPAPCLRHAELVERLRALEARHRGRLAVEEVGRSLEGRAIHLLTVGRGQRRVLLWSQMHGDEPSATPALLDVADRLLRSPDGAVVLDELTLLIVPMLNPDGAERRARRNAQGIDVNRDALQLSTPEGRLLKALRDRFSPALGFNLHDQDRRTTAGGTGRLATIALLAVSGDEKGTLTPGRARARRVCALLARTLAPFAGGVARYDEDWNPRAFGDNLTAWGTPVVLVESGGLPPGRPAGDLTRLNYVGLIAALAALARDDAAGEDPAAYESLPRNSGGFVDVLIAGGRLAQPSAAEPYRADLGFDVLDDAAALAACAGASPGAPSRIREVGDGRLLSAARRVEADGRLVVPGFVAAVRGRAARAWLDRPALAAMARLGVTRVLWHVAGHERAAVVSLVSRLEAPGLPSIRVVAGETSSALLSVRTRPAAPAGATLAAAFDALTGRAWRAPAGRRSLVELLPSLAAVAPGGDPTPVLLAPDAPASAVVLRPVAEGLLPDQLELEQVFVDGREAPAALR
jgi:hypothetical protein